MKVIVLSTERTEEVLEEFIAFGYNDFIVFGSVCQEYYSVNGIKVVQVAGFPKEGTRDKLLKIRGSLNDTFIIAYFTMDVDLDELEQEHRKGQAIATLIEKNNMLCGCVLEPEIFDYLEENTSLERETLLRLGQDGELYIHN